MILADSNVWIALAVAGHAYHDSVRRWFESIGASDRLLFCRATQQATLRLLTNASLLGAYGRAPLTNNEAWTLYRELLADDRIGFQSTEPAATGRLWEEYSRRDTPSPKLWMDAYLAAFAVAGGLSLVTTDGAFQQFAGLDAEVIAVS